MLQELEKWTFCKNRAPRQGLLLDTSSDESEDETTCAVRMVTAMQNDMFSCFQLQRWATISTAQVDYLTEP